MDQRIDQSQDKILDQIANKNLKDCMKYKHKWVQCSSNTFFKYYDYDYDNNFNEPYYHEMSRCFKFYKKYHNCLNKHI